MTVSRSLADKGLPTHFELGWEDGEEGERELEVRDVLLVSLLRLLEVEHGGIGALDGVGRCMI